MAFDFVCQRVDCTAIWSQKRRPSVATAQYSRTEDAPNVGRLDTFQPPPDDLTRSILSSIRRPSLLVGSKTGNSGRTESVSCSPEKERVCGQPRTGESVYRTSTSRNRFTTCAARQNLKFLEPDFWLVSKESHPPRKPAFSLLLFHFGG